MIILRGKKTRNCEKTIRIIWKSHKSVGLSQQLYSSPEQIWPCVSAFTPLLNRSDPGSVSAALLLSWTDLTLGLCQCLYSCPEQIWPCVSAFTPVLNRSDPGSVSVPLLLSRTDLTLCQCLYSSPEQIWPCISGSLSLANIRLLCLLFTLSVWRSWPTHINRIAHELGGDFFPKIRNTLYFHESCFFFCV